VVQSETVTVEVVHADVDASAVVVPGVDLSALAAVAVPERTPGGSSAAAESWGGVGGDVNPSGGGTSNSTPLSLSASVGGSSVAHAAAAVGDVDGGAASQTVSPSLRPALPSPAARSVGVDVDASINGGGALGGRRGSSGVVAVRGDEDGVDDDSDEAEDGDRLLSAAVSEVGSDDDSSDGSAVAAKPLPVSTVVSIVAPPAGSQSGEPVSGAPAVAHGSRSGGRTGPASPQVSPDVPATDAVLSLVSPLSTSVSPSRPSPQQRQRPRREQRPQQHREHEQQQHRDHEQQQHRDHERQQPRSSPSPAARPRVTVTRTVRPSVKPWLLSPTGSDVAVDLDTPSSAVSPAKSPRTLL
jgi:hypothetical protein